MKILLTYIGFIALFSCNVSPQIIYEWRGPQRSGIYNDAGLMKEWPEKGPEEIWYVEGIGNGYGSPVTDGEHLYLTGEIDSIAMLQCLDMKGLKEWKTDLGGEWTKSYPGSRSAPTIVGDRLYVGTGMGHLYCIAKETGIIIWRKDFDTDFHGIYPMFGHSEAPAVSGDKVFWTPGGDEYNVVALNRYNGQMIWSHKGFSERSGYNQPVVIDHNGRKIFVTFSAYHMMGFDIETGEMLWSHEQESYPPEKRAPGYGDTHSNTVIYENNCIYYAEGDGNCGVKLELSEDGSEIKEMWRNKEFDSYMGGIVKFGNYLYGSGTADPGLFSIHTTSGKIKDSLKAGRGALIAADGMLYYYNHQGHLKLISYSEGKLKQVSSFRVSRGTNEHFSHPVIHNGILYLRHGDVLMAFNLKTETT